MDIRRGSPTYGKHIATELSAKSGGTSFTFPLALPMGSSHSRTMLSLCTRSATTTSLLDSGIRWDDPEIAISWPCKDADITISDKDRGFHCLRISTVRLSMSGQPLEPLKVTELG